LVEDGALTAGLDADHGIAIGHENENLENEHNTRSDGEDEDEHSTESDDEPEPDDEPIPIETKRIKRTLKPRKDWMLQANQY
jgi:hypothetical protein